MFEKRNDSMQKSMDTETVEETIDFTLQTTEVHADKAQVSHEPEAVQGIVQEIAENPERIHTSESGFLMLPRDHPEYTNLIRLQLENQELLKWKEQLQARINTERAECVHLKRMEPASYSATTSLSSEDPEYEQLVDHLMKENLLLEQKRSLLAQEIIDENISLIQLQVDLAMKVFIH